MTDRLISFITLFVVFASLQMTAQTNFWQQTNGPFGGGVFAIGQDSTGGLLAGNSSLYRTSNRGVVWSRMFSLSGYATITSISVKGSNDYFVAFANAGFYRTTDGCNTWTRIDSGLTNTDVYSTVITDSGHIVVGTYGIYVSTDDGSSWLGTGPAGIHAWTITRTEAGDLFAATDHGVYHSTNGGYSWIEKSRGLTNRDVGGIVSSSNGDLYVAAMYDPDSVKGVFASTDDGENWTRTTLAAQWISSIAVDRSQNVFAGTDSGIYRSTDRGNQWINVNNGSVSLVQSLFVDSDGNINVGTGADGMFVSTNAGDNWTRIGLPSAPTYALLARPSGNILAGTYSGVHASSDNGDTWIQSTFANRVVNCLTTDLGGYLFAGTNGNGIYRSLDDGLNWAQVYAATGLQNFYSLAVNMRGYVFAGAMGRIFMSTNRGNTWAQSGLTTGWVRTIATKPNGDVFAGASAVYRSTNDGVNWSVCPGTNWSNIFGISIDSHGDVFAASVAGVYRSSDNGDSWTYLGHANSISGALFIDSANSIFLATQLNGIFRSTDDGETWDSVSTGMMSSSYTSFAMNSDDYLFVGTTDKGVFRSTNRLTSVSSTNATKPFAFELGQNYPNPFNPSTTIRYALPHTSFVTLTVYNTLGQQVAQLVNEQQQTGYHDVVFRGDQLASGVYFYRLDAGSYTSVKKLLLLK